MAFVALAAPGGFGCSTFEEDWAALAPIDGERREYHGIEGPWEGSWICELTGHDGGLRCIVSRDEAGAYSMRYHATWSFIITHSAEYTITAEVTPEPETYTLEGVEDVGLIWGDFRYDGVATPALIVCRYESWMSKGIFTLKRPDPPPDPTSPAPPVPDTRSREPGTRNREPSSTIAPSGGP